MKKIDFLKQLQNEAKNQSLLEQHRLLPEKLSFIADPLARYFWQIIVFLALITATLRVLVEA